MFCENCGSQLSDNAKFCTKCGNKIILEDFKTPQINKRAPETTKSVPNRFPVKQEAQKGNIEEIIKDKSKLLGSGCLIIFVFIILVIVIKSCIGPDTNNAQKQEESHKQTTAKTENNSDDKDQRLFNVYVPTKAWFVIVHEFFITTEINEVEYMNEVAEDGTLFLIGDIEFINHTKETQSFSSIWEQFSITCDEGYSFSENIMNRAMIKNAFEDGEILPSKKRRGKIVFRVNDDITNAVFEIRFLDETRRWPLFNDKYKRMKLKEIHKIALQKQ